MINLQPKYKNITETESALDSSKIIDLKNYISKNVDVSKDELASMGLIPVVLGNGDKVINQYPLKNTTVVSGNKVFLLTNSNSYTMPDVTGYSRNDIINLCKMLNLNYNIEGYGKVVSTSIGTGSNIDLNSTITINLG